MTSANAEALDTAASLHERADRRPVFRDAMLLLNCSSRRVALRNFSATGAKIETHIWAELPQFVLLTEPTLDIRCKARVVWQHHGEAGLEFME